MMNDAMFFVRTWKKKSARERMCVISLIRNPALQRTNQTGGREGGGTIYFSPQAFKTEEGCYRLGRWVSNQRFAHKNELHVPGGQALKTHVASGLSMDAIHKSWRSPTSSFFNTPRRNQTGVYITPQALKTEEATA